MENFESIIINSKYFNFLNCKFFMYEFSNLPEIKKKLFKNKDQFDTIKYDFKCWRNYIYSLNTIITTSTIGCSYLIYDKFSPYLFLKAKFLSRIKFPILALVGITSLKLSNSMIQYNISHIIPADSKFQLYLLFETNFRNDTLMFVIENLNAKYDDIFEKFNRSEIKNLEKLELFLFYHDIKSHYLCMTMINRLLVELNGYKYLKMFKNYTYYDSDIHKGIFYYLRKNVSREFYKLLLNKNEGFADDLELPLINNDNYTNYFDDFQSSVLIQEEILKRVILNEYNL